MVENEAKWFDILFPVTSKHLTLSEAEHETALLKEEKMGSTSFRPDEWRMFLHLKSF